MRGLPKLTSLLAKALESGTLKLTAIPTYANNAAAVAGGKKVGEVYKTAAGALMIVV